MLEEFVFDKVLLLKKNILYQPRNYQVAQLASSYKQEWEVHVFMYVHLL